MRGKWMRGKVGKGKIDGVKWMRGKVDEGKNGWGKVDMGKSGWGKMETEGRLEEKK